LSAMGILQSGPFEKRPYRAASLAEDGASAASLMAPSRTTRHVAPETSTTVETRPSALPVEHAVKAIEIVEGFQHWTAL